MSASELLAKLQQDPDFVQREAVRVSAADSDRALVLKALDPVTKELRAAGVLVDSVDDLARRHSPLNREVATLLCTWLEKIENEKAREEIVRALAAAKRGYNGTSLAKAFDQSENVNFRWVVANTIASSRPAGIGTWLESRVSDPEVGRAREMLLLAAGRLLPKNVAATQARQALAEFPGHAAIVLAAAGDEHDLETLNEALQSGRPWERFEIEKAIAKIRKRSGA